MHMVIRILFVVILVLSLQAQAMEIGTEAFRIMGIVSTVVDPSNPRDTSDESVDSKEVLRVVSGYYDDLSSCDWDRFASHFWPTASIATVWKPEGEASDRVYIHSVEEFIRKAPEGPGSKEIFEEKMIDAKIDVRGDLAFVWARYEARFGDPGDVFTWSGTDALTLIRHQGQWRIVSLAFVADDGEGPGHPSEESQMSSQQYDQSLKPGTPHHGLAQFTGRWQGTTKTYFEPGKLADESPVEGQIESILGGRFLQYEYTGSLKGKPFTGKAIIGFSTADKRFEMCLIDSFHTGTAIMFSTGEGEANHFSVLGSYSVGPGAPPWGWRTEFILKSENELLINAYNITPDGQEALALETVLTKIE